jgi:hypothetical protein
LEESIVLANWIDIRRPADSAEVIRFKEGNEVGLFVLNGEADDEKGEGGDG